ncbi:branched-chain amino acid ABC transporter permease [Baekduia soli]|uniref:Branched-chain amino acid ABC transporter permease n=1 Tax=Baekduia soli TaxID=496014 RepID=A0A5B8U2Z3_9ACTN|nr:branched-chain amino acid ABC transporter permease [Baekduia soli]QEC47429.1 branched-chain amino acid ABC transporter permease [Baekduia soli]
MRRIAAAVPVVVVAVLALLAPSIVGTDYYVSLLVTFVVVAIAALSLDIVIGHMGQFSFGHAAFWGIGAYASAKLTYNEGFPVWLGVLCAILMSGLAGLVVGLVVLKRNRGLELAMVTLGLGVLLATVAGLEFNFTGGEAGILGIPPLTFLGFDAITPTRQYFFVLVILVVVVYLMSRVSASRFGRAVHSLREGEHLAASIGIRVAPTYALAFAGAAALGGLAGALYGHTLGYVSPTFFNLTFMFEFLIMVVVGGSGTLGGPILGAGLYVAVTEISRNISEESRLLIFGVILFFVAVFLPRGLYPTLKSGVVRLIDLVAPPPGPPGADVSPTSADGTRAVAATGARGDLG